MKRKITAILLVLSILCTAVGCNSGSSKKISGKPGGSQIQVSHVRENDVKTNDFSLDLLKDSLNKEGNTIISPMSVLCALAMTSNGAGNETLGQMEEVLGMSLTELNESIYTYRNNLPDDKKCQVNLANSIWFTDHMRFTVNEDFLQTNADYYGAEIFETPFNQSTVKDMNQWINKNTNGMIKEMISDISDSAVMFLINALTFEAEWQEEYQEFQVNTGKFTGEDGKTRGVDFMESEENYYIENSLGTGVIKPYYGGKTAFVGLLPKEGMTVEDYLTTLTGADMYDMIKNRQNTSVITKIPKFEMEYALSMADILKQMGMTDAFDEDLADFTGLGVSEAGNIFISDVIHKSYINVDEKGTEAGAATAVIMTDGASAVLDEPEPKYVILDRPFIYMILDLENHVPLFMGTYMMPEEN